MALPFKRSIGALAWGTGALNVPLPAGYHVNDILVLVAATAYGETLNVAGWAHAPDSPALAGAGVQLNVLWRRATGSEGAITGDSGDHQIARIAAFGDVLDTGSPFDVTNKGFTGVLQAVTIPGDTTTDPDTLCLVAAAFANDLDQDGFVSGWTNADLANIEELFDNLKDIGNGGGIALITGERAVAGVVGNTTATKVADGDYAGWFGALIGSDTSGDEVPESEESFESEEEIDPPDEVANDNFAIDTWQFDTTEPEIDDRDVIPWFLTWQLMDNAAEATNKQLTAVRATGKFTDTQLTIHAASPGDIIDRADLKSGDDARITVEFPDSDDVTRYERSKIKAKNLSIWTARLAGEWDGLGRKDRLDELIIEGQPHGVTK